MRKLFALMLAAGCSGGSSGNSQIVAGFDPPKPASGELQILSPPVRNLPSGANVIYCSYLEQNVSGETDVIGSYGTMTNGGHHAILYVARQQKAAGTHECTEDDMLNVSYLAGTGAGESLASAIGQLPDTVAFRVPAGAQLMMQTHFINASLKPIDGQAAIYLKTAPASSGRIPADLFTVVDTMLAVPAGQMGDVQTTCTLPEDKNLFFLGGHEHQWGTHVNVQQVTGGSGTAIYDKDWQPEYEFNPPLNVYSTDAPLALKSGDSVQLKCSYDNTAGATDLTFPTEMCVTFGFYFPGHGEIDCVDGQWPTM
jgi:hypothetical protein